MEARLKSLATLAVLALVLLVAALWGWSAVSEPFPERADPPLCIERTYQQGDTLSRGDVTVSVLNAGTRNGLAGLTLELLIDAGFAEGREANAPDRTSVRFAQIWTELPRRHPAVQLVRSHFRPEPQVVERDPGVAGIAVVVGDGFQDLDKGRRQIKVGSTIETCGPPAIS